MLFYSYGLAHTVNANATSNLLSALQSTSPSSYQSTSAITFYYNQGRNELAAGNYIVPQTTALLTPAAAALSVNITAQFIQSASDISAVKAAATNAPTALSDGVAFQMVDLRPFSLV